MRPAIVKSQDDLSYTSDYITQLQKPNSSGSTLGKGGLLDITILGRGYLVDITTLERGLLRERKA